MSLVNRQLLVRLSLSLLLFVAVAGRSFANPAYSSCSTTIESCEVSDEVACDSCGCENATCNSCGPCEMPACVPCHLPSCQGCVANMKCCSCNCCQCVWAHVEPYVCWPYKKCCHVINFCARRMASQVRRRSAARDDSSPFLLIRSLSWLQLRCRRLQISGQSIEILATRLPALTERRADHSFRACRALPHADPKRVGSYKRVAIYCTLCWHASRFGCLVKLGRLYVPALCRLRR